MILLQGRVTLAKSVLNSVPIHNMTVYKWLCSVIKKGDNILRNYIWIGDPTKRKGVTRKWDKVFKQGTEEWEKFLKSKFSSKSDIQGVFSTKNTYETLRSKEDSAWWCKYILRQAIHPRLGGFAWPLLSHILPMDDAIMKKGISIVLECHQCHSASEMESYTLLQYPLAVSLWQKASACFSYTPITPSDNWRTILERGKTSSPYIANLWVAMVFPIYSNITRARNKCRFDGVQTLIQQTTLHIQTDIVDASLLSKSSMDDTIQDLRIIKELNVLYKPRVGNNIESCICGFPTQEKVKICCDGLALGNLDIAGIGIIYRNNKGEILSTYSKSIGKL
ncbi:hypothetical protein GIB67_006488 [Kingdonia uniflora]|uniref:Reverse transcriptase zinc-binding domain-containing protein n=1 Tax=Kingdonia uniflora TaxID=39325 RepID=A0A7J7LEI5_9MAGN|nr:hypothetical protein GIB67_006488 [Kingdonia uniflora]